MIRILLFLLLLTTQANAWGTSSNGFIQINPQVRPDNSSAGLPAVDDNFTAGGYPVAGGICAEWGHRVPCGNHYSTTRASTKYVTTSDGVLAIVPTNTLGQAFGNGALIEEARTNLTLQSKDYTVTATWTEAGSATTRTAASTTAPDGTLTGQLVADNTTANANYGFTQAFAITASTTYSFTIYVKKKDYSFVQLNLRTGAGPTNRFAYYNLDTGAVTNTSAIVSGSMTALANNWWRLELIATSGVGEVLGQPTIIYTTVAGTSTHIGVVGTGNYFWQADTEAGSFSTSTIPTTTVSATRAADVVSGAGAVLSTFNVFPVNNWAATSVNLIARPPVNTASIIAPAASGTSRADTYVDTPANSGVISIYAEGGASAVTRSAFTPTAGTTFGLAANYKPSLYAISPNGASPTNNVTTASPTFSTVGIGYNAGVGGLQLNGSLRRFATGPGLLSTSLLQSFSSIPP